MSFAGLIKNVAAPGGFDKFCSLRPAASHIPDLTKSSPRKCDCRYMQYYALEGFSCDQSGKCKVLICLKVRSFSSYALFILSADDLGDFSGIL